MKATLKSVAVALSILAMVLVILTAVDKANDITVSATNTSLKVYVVDLNNMPVHNAKVTVNGQSFYTDNKGLSPAIEVLTITNCYDDTISEWGTVNVRIEKENFVPTFVFNCVVYCEQTRRLTVKIYGVDSSDLPYVNYVESPPDSYIKNLLETAKK